MPGKARVHELAKELGISSKEVLSKLAELGEYVKGPSSTVEAPVVGRLMGHLGGREISVIPSAADSATVAIDREAAAVRGALGLHTRARAMRRPWYKGPAPKELAKEILDTYIAPRRGPMFWRKALPPNGGYYDDEVKRANAIVLEWLEVVFDDDIMAADIVCWLNFDERIKPEHAAEFHRAGVRPRDIPWADDQRRASVDYLNKGWLKVSQVIEGVRFREASSRR